MIRPVISNFNAELRQDERENIALTLREAELFVAPEAHYQFRDR